jgi:hypothetical protein
MEPRRRPITLTPSELHAVEGEGSSMLQWKNARLFTLLIVLTSLAASFGGTFAWLRNFSW